MSVRATRRELMTAGAAGVAGLLTIPSAAAAATSSAAQAPAWEVDRLQRLIRLELLLLYCYRHVLGSGVLGPEAERVLAPFPGHEQAHIAALERRLTARGGTVPTGPDSIATANRYLANRGVGGRLGHLKGHSDALYLLLTLEQVTIGAYFVALTKLRDTELIQLACEIMANEAQHDAVIGLTLPKGTPASAVPYALVQGLQ